MVDLIAVAIVVAAAPAATLFPLYYGLTAPWWKSAVGRAAFTSSLGLGLLIDISLAYRFLGDDYALRDAVRLTVYGLILLGAWLQLGALVIERRRGRRDTTRTKG